MKSFAAFICIVLLFQLLPADSYAAFPLKKNAAPQGTTVTAEKLLPPAPMPAGNKKEGMGYGIASLACGIISYISFVAAVSSATPEALYGPAAVMAMTAIAAVATGAVGFNKRFKGMAIAGFTLGCIMLTISLLALAAYSSQY
jgi:hypothetical protein